MRRGRLLLSAGCGGSAPPTVSFSTTSTTGLATTSTVVTNTVPIDTLIGPEGIDYESNPALAPANPRLTGEPIAGVQCQSLRQLAYQSHTHLQMYVRGHPRALPGGIGMVKPSLSQTAGGPEFTAPACYYWLQTITQDGVIATQSPLRRTFTLGQFFSIWGQPLSRETLGPARGHVTAIVDGRRWHGSPRSIPLREHESIELAAGRPVPAFKAVDWSASNL